MRKVLALCGVVVLAAALAVAQDKDEDKTGDKKKGKKPTVQEVEAKYSPQIKRLKGVRDVKLAIKGEEEFIVIEVDTKETRGLLDNLLSDKLEGYKLLFEVVGKKAESEPGAQAEKPEKEDKPAKETPLCFKCAGPKYLSEKGLCKECGGWTMSTAFKYCDDCARKLGVCARCGKPFKQGK
jgi:hypothetical protein